MHLMCDHIGILDLYFCSRAILIVVVDYIVVATHTCVGSVAFAPVVHHIVAQVYLLSLYAACIVVGRRASPSIAGAIESWTTIGVVCQEIVVE